MTSPTTAPAGWYPDGALPGVLRWFDGTSWTEHVTPDQSAMPAQPSARPDAVGGDPAPWQPLVPLAAQPAVASAAAPGPWQQQGPWQQHGAWQQQGPWQQPGAWEQPAPWQYAQPAPADNGPSTAVHWMLPVGRSWQSVVAGYLGLLSLGFWVLGPFAIASGVWALVRAQDGGHGRGRAITGILGGGIGCVILLAFALNAGG
ncbi:DUF2510 domain-containing protein [Actinotalea sp. Marseille-Q4924]|uniref:DUF2510 domain-containing protein n=1 Tax=Actinotalea sp. Marseille-Q4924 TaxID=2866571 RepID=UPI001CE495B8|nr:DUF2510 domain-containing protein [Actinotalea sp. Marseille-Q4924]